MSVSAIKPRSNIIPVRVRLMNETPMTEYCRTVRRHWLDTVKLMEAAPFGSDDREILAYIAEVAEELYRDAQFCQAEVMEDIMARRIDTEDRRARAVLTEVRRKGVELMRSHHRKVESATGPNAGFTVNWYRAEYQAIHGFCQWMLGDKADGMEEEAKRVD